MVEKKTIPKKNDPEKPATFKERLIQSAILGAVLGAPTFWVIATAVNWTTRPAEYRAQLAEIKKIEKAIKANHRPLTHVPLFKWIYKLPHGEEEIMAISSRLKKGRLDSAEKRLDVLYNQFKDAIASNRDLQAQLQAIKKTESFKKRFPVESERRIWWPIKGALASGLIGAGVVSGGAGNQALRTRKQNKGNPQRPRSGGRKH